MLEPMHIARSVDFEPTGRVEEFGVGRVDGKASISYSIFGATSRQNEQPTTANINVSSP